MSSTPVGNAHFEPILQCVSRKSRMDCNDSQLDLGSDLNLGLGSFSWCLLAPSFARWCLCKDVNVFQECVVGWSSFVADIAEKVKVSASGESADDDDNDDNDVRLCEYFPTFVWAVRDFTLELSADGKAISADEYLENALTLKKGFSHFLVRLFYRVNPIKPVLNFHPYARTYVRTCAYVRSSVHKNFLRFQWNLACR